jgi:hypothetical protein
MKTMAKSEESRPRHLSDDRDYAEALARLERLNAGQKEAIERQESLEQQMNREEQTRRQVSRGPGAFNHRFSDQDLDGFAAQVATSGCISESLIAELRRGARVYGADEFNC